MKRTLINTLLASTAFLGSVGVQAAMISQWQVDVSTVFDTTSVVWDHSNGGPSPTTVTPTQLIWGIDGGSGRSGLAIGSTPISTTVNTNGAAVNNITITHTNRPITGTTLDSVDIWSTLTLTPLLPPSAGLPPATMVFNVNFQETTNDVPGNPGTCADGGLEGVGVNGNGCADIFVISQDSLNFSFDYYDPDLSADRTYYISFFEATNGLNSLSSQACSAAGAGYPCLGFETTEGEQTTAQFAARITSQPIHIPEPGTLAILGIGLAGLGVMRRRQA